MYISIISTEIYGSKGSVWVSTCSGCVIWEGSEPVHSKPVSSKE